MTNIMNGMSHTQPIDRTPVEATQGIPDFTHGHAQRHTEFTGDVLPEHTLDGAVGALEDLGYTLSRDADGRTLFNPDGSITLTFNPYGVGFSHPYEQGDTVVSRFEGPSPGELGTERGARFQRVRLTLAALAITASGATQGTGNATERTTWSETTETIRTRVPGDSRKSQQAIELPNAEYAEDFSSSPESSEITDEAKEKINNLVKYIKEIQDSGGTVTSLNVGGRISAEDENPTNGGIDSISEDNQKLGDTRGIAAAVVLLEALTSEGAKMPETITLGEPRGDIMDTQEIRNMSLISKEYGLSINQLIESYNDGKISDPRLNTLLLEKRGSYAEITVEIPSNEGRIVNQTIKVPLKDISIDLVETPTVDGVLASKTRRRKGREAKTRFTPTPHEGLKDRYPDNIPHRIKQPNGKNGSNRQGNRRSPKQ